MNLMSGIMWMLVLFIMSGPVAAQPNLVIITIDGMRWQEVFTGADSALINDARYTPDTALQKALYWDADAQVRRKKLLPFFWSVMQGQAQLFGNRQFGNHVNVANPWHISYAGYNEMFTGTTDIRVSTNAKKNNRHHNIFETLNSMDAYRDRVALFSSWDVLPYILKKEQNDYFFNSAYDTITEGSLLEVQRVQEQGVFQKSHTRHDWLTWISAREYLAARRPKVLYIALGETDEWAHQKRYDLYLHHANAFDRMLAELWNWLQTTEGYKNNTSLVITTDHGRGSHAGNWYRHGIFVNGSSQTWMALATPGITTGNGEQQTPGQLYQYQLPGIIMQLLEASGQQASHHIEKPSTYAINKSK